MTRARLGRIPQLASAGHAIQPAGEAGNVGWPANPPRRIAIRDGKSERSCFRIRPMAAHGKKSPAPKAGEESVLQLKVTLRGSRPPIWRRIQVLDSSTLADLHDVIQVIMNWTDSHLHLFEVKGKYYTRKEQETDLDFGVPDNDSSGVTLADLRLRQKGQKFRYIYDFGDDWVHQLAVEAVLPKDPEAFYPVCLTGRRASPPEDCGGIWGYYSLLEVLGDPDHPEHAEMLEWAGGPIVQAEFSASEVNEILRSWHG